jgi:hypothetical protein
MELKYLQQASFSSDAGIVLQTVSRIFAKVENVLSNPRVQDLGIEKVSPAMQIDEEPEYASSADGAD